MKIQLVSDLHLEFDSCRINNAGADVLILSGDICVAQYFSVSEYSPNYEIKKDFKDFFSYVSNEFNHVIYIPGNHEHYRGNFALIREYIRKAEFPPNIHFLDNESVTIDGVKFFGTTLWTDFNNYNPLTMSAVQAGLNDYRLVKNIQEQAIYRTLIPRDTYQYHQIALKLIGEQKPDVVVGHHAPSYKSISGRYADPKYYHLNGGYASNLENFILENPNIKLWTHGHMHSNSDYLVGNTRVVCNPKGYKNENPNFNSSMILEI